MKRKRPAFTPSFPAFQKPPETTACVGASKPSLKVDYSRGLPLDDERQSRHSVPRARLIEIYEAFMRSPRWREKRTPILLRANNYCERCGLFCEALAVHHLNYDRLGGGELLADLEALCSPCHAIADKERHEEWLDALAVLAEEAEQRKENRAFDTWMRRDYGEFWWHQDKIVIDLEQERFDQWREKKDAEEI